MFSVKASLMPDSHRQTVTLLIPMIIDIQSSFLQKSEWKKSHNPHTLAYFLNTNNNVIDF